MASTTTPNMQLVVPGVGTEAGPTYATDINSSLMIVDGHDHTSGSGVRITPSGININSSLAMNNQVLASTAAVTFFAQGSPPANASTYVSGTDLYFVDGAGNNIRITQSGSVSGASGTITGLPSGTASAAFAAGTFTFQSATNTGANVDGASFILRNSTASSFGLTLSPPNAMAAGYSLVLPALPAQTNVMTLDSSGNMGSTTWNAVAANRTRTTGSTVGLGGVAISSSSGAFQTSSSSTVQVTNLSVTITTSGRPVYIGLISDGNTSASTPSTVGISRTSTNSTSGFFVVARGGVEINNMQMVDTSPFSASSAFVPPASVAYIDIVSAGTYTYTLKASLITGTAIYVSYCKLIAYEL